MATNNIKYTLTFFSDWHAGSGLSAGAETDAVVIKDSNNLPFLPGKTIKGLVRDALMDIATMQKELVPTAVIERLLGKEVVINQETKSSFAGTLFFSNAHIPQGVANEISLKMSHHLYRTIASTAIERNGITKKGSLRSMEVCIPIQLEGYIDGIDPEDIHFIDLAFKLIRHAGVGRNRGLGRCQFEIKS